MDREEIELDEVLTIQQREKRRQIIRRYETKIERARELARKKMAPEKNIKKRAYAQARQIVRKRVAGQRGAEYEKLGPSEKMAIDRAVETKTKLIKKLAARLIPRVKQAEQQRLAAFMKGQALTNNGQPEGNSKVNEQFNNLFNEGFPPYDTAGVMGRSVDSPVVGNRMAAKVGNTTTKDNKDPKGKNSPIIQYQKFGEDLNANSSAFKGLVKKSEKSGIDLEALGEVYNRGLDAWRETYNVSPSQYAFARVNSYINQGKTYFNEDADLHENAWNQLGQKKPVGNTLPAPKRGSVEKHGRRFSEGDYVVPHTGPHAGEVHKVTSSRVGSVNIVNPYGHKYDSITVRAKHEHLSPATKQQTDEHKTKVAATAQRMSAAIKEEKNAPTNPDLWSRAKSLARQKFDVYPSAYANGWAAKYYKSKGGGWKTVSEETVDEHIVKVKNGYELKSKSTGRNLGTYPTKAGAEKREKQVQYFKHQNEEAELDEATYKGKTVPLNKPMPGDVKKSKVYVDPDGDGKAQKVNFGSKELSIKKHIPARKKSYCARSAGQGSLTDKTSANYWSRRAWNCEETEIDEVKAQPYVKPLHDESGKHVGWKSSNGHHVKFWQLFAKKSAEKHAGITEAAGESILPQTPGIASKRRMTAQSVERDSTPSTPTSDADAPTSTKSSYNKEAQIKKKILEAGNVQNNPKKRLLGTDSLVKAYVKDTPCMSVNEAFNIAFASGIDVTLTSKDHGMQIQGGFSHHPSVVDEMERLRLENEFEEEVEPADRKPVVVRAHKDAYGNTIPAKSYFRKRTTPIVNADDNPNDGQ